MVASVTGHSQVMPRILRGSRERHSALHVLGFQLLGWTRPQQQHDVAELIDFLHPRLAAEVIRGRIKSRSEASEGISIQPEEDCTKCLRLIRQPKHTPELQALIQFWHEQDRLFGITEPVPWLFLQLPRLRLQHRQTKKTQQQYHHADHVSIPVFRDRSSLHVSWHDYKVSGYIQHHGPAVTSGHYTTLRVNGADWWCLDDAKTPCLLTAEKLAIARRSMYVIVLVLSQPLSVAVASTPCNGSLASASSGPHPIRVGLGSEPSASSGLPASRTLSRDAEIAAGVQRLNVQNDATREAHGVDQTAQLSFCGLRLYS